MKEYSYQRAFSFHSLKKKKSIFVSDMPSVEKYHISFRIRCFAGLVIQCLRFTYMWD